MPPVIIVAVPNDETRAAVVDALERRYRADYDVIGMAALSALPDLIGKLTRDGRVVALAIAPIDAASDPCWAAVTAHYPTARRIALLAVGDTSAATSLTRALTLNTIDYYFGHPWATPEEELYPVTGEALRVWSRDEQLHYDKATIVDTPTGRRGPELESWLSRNGVAATFHPTTSPTGSTLISGPLAGIPLPAVLLYNGQVLGDPAYDVLAESLGAHTRPADARYDLTIVGAGPAGLAAAAHAAAEGLRTLIIEQFAVGGQASTSPKIRNYLGFRWGISGRDLAADASHQAEQLGAEFVISRAATRLTTDGDDHLVTLANGSVARSGSVMLAGGVAYRQLGVASVDGMVGRGVFYGAGWSEIADMGGRRVFVLGAGNSAGQAACALANAGADVTMLVRGDSLGATMSDYLVQQVTATPSIAVRTGTQVLDAVGTHQLDCLIVCNSNGTTQIAADALFIFIGARPHTQWLAGTILLDAKGFILTGRDLPPNHTAAWLETSTAGVFAAGDIRHGSIKRVAAAVGEGTTAATLAHNHLTP